MWNTCKLAGVSFHVTPYLKLRVLHNKLVLYFIVMFPYNACSDWVKQHALSENREWVDDIKLAFFFGISNLTQIKHPLCDSDKININELFVSSIYGSWRPSLTTVSVKTVRKQQVLLDSDKTRSETNSQPSEFFDERHQNIL